MRFLKSIIADTRSFNRHRTLSKEFGGLSNPATFDTPGSGPKDKRVELNDGTSKTESNVGLSQQPHSRQLVTSSVTHSNSQSFLSANKKNAGSNVQKEFSVNNKANTLKTGKPNYIGTSVDIPVKSRTDENSNNGVKVQSIEIEKRYLENNADVERNRIEKTNIIHRQSGKKKKTGFDSDPVTSKFKPIDSKVSIHHKKATEQYLSDHKEHRTQIYQNQSSKLSFIEADKSYKDDSPMGSPARAVVVKEKKRIEEPYNPADPTGFVEDSVNRIESHIDELTKVNSQGKLTDKEKPLLHQNKKINEAINPQPEVIHDAESVEPQPAKHAGIKTQPYQKRFDIAVQTGEKVIDQNNQLPPRYAAIQTQPYQKRLDITVQTGEKIIDQSNQISDFDESINIEQTARPKIENQQVFSGSSSIDRNSTSNSGSREVRIGQIDVFIESDKSEPVAKTVNHSVGSSISTDSRNYLRRL